METQAVSSPVELLQWEMEASKASSNQPGRASRKIQTSPQPHHRLMIDAPIDHEYLTINFTSNRELLHPPFQHLPPSHKRPHPLPRRRPLPPGQEERTSIHRNRPARPQRLQQKQRQQQHLQHRSPLLHRSPNRPLPPGPHNSHHNHPLPLQLHLLGAVLAALLLSHQRLRHLPQHPQHVRRGRAGGSGSLGGGVWRRGGVRG